MPADPRLSPDDGALPRELDVVIIGAGPAGISAAVVAQALKLRVALLEAGEKAGGQLLRNPTPILDAPGLDVPTGMAMADRLMDHLTRLGGQVRTGGSAARVHAASGEVEVSGELLRAKFLLLATGARPRTLGIPGESGALGRGPSPAARRFGDLYRGRTVLVVGGGDVALEEAALFARICERVFLVHRGSELRGCADFRAAVAAEPRIEVLLETTLLSIEGEAEVRGARLRGPEGAFDVKVDGVFICAGLAPNSELIRGQAELDAQGFVHTDIRQRTSAPRLYAAGDVCAGSAWSVAAALGQAAIAVKDMERRLWRDEPR
ncbi:FAD-dependent oxidoreductase [Polyangium sp. 6x1]|uniref:NAD(P)/FAD-dependent oxidoreductase n=1 Tax=Polyangium sp. 6x1 TaxID=3042689 RepID=UPI002482FA77|nr:FAD-dependent oxidoreductase [Polyangium sp. 6x1]MDI1451925.1 FAD-dependent oxidoreductase [Polyangium sp. 6x1]